MQKQKRLKKESKKVVYLRLPVSMVQDVQNVAKIHQISVNEFFRRCVDRELKKAGGKG